MSRYPHEAILFEVIRENGAPIPVGEVVEFFDWFDDRCEGIEARHAFGNDYGCPDVAAWSYHPDSLRPLTPAAVAVLKASRVQL